MIMRGEEWGEDRFFGGVNQGGRERSFEGMLYFIIFRVFYFSARILMVKECIY